jgi:hypothetical protein
MAVEIPSWMHVENDGWDTETIEETPGYSFYNSKIKLFFDASKHEYYRFNKEGERVEVPGCTTVLKTAIDKSQMLMPWATKLAIDTLKLRMFNPDGTLKSYSTEELFSWFAEAKDKHKERLDEAGDIGHVAHDALERTIQYAINNTGGVVEKLFPVDNFYETEKGKMAQSCFEAGIDWIHKHKVVFKHTERKVYSLEYDVAGTLDGVGLVSSCDELKCCRGKVFHQTPALIDWKSSNQIRNEYAIQAGFYVFAQLEEFPDEPIYLRFICRLGKLDGKFEPWLITADSFEQDLETFLAALTLYRNLKALEERRRVDKAELKAIMQPFKDAERDARQAAKKAEERAQRALVQAEKQPAREASKLATQARNEAKDAHYKALRSSGMSPTDAKIATSRTFPKAEKEDKIEPKVKPKLKPVASSGPPQVASTDPDVEFVVNL